MSLINQTLSPISGELARKLSSRLAPIGDQIYDIWSDLDRAGYGATSAIVRASYLAQAVTPEASSQLHSYWRELAKEILAALNPPFDFFRGHLPEHSSYRSELLDTLRANAPNLPSGNIKTRQIEPTIKRYIESIPNAQSLLVRQKAPESRRVAAKMLGLAERSEFGKERAAKRYQLLIDRYSSKLLPFGFVLDPSSELGLVYRKATENKKWDFIFADGCRDSITAGRLSPAFGITTPNSEVLGDNIACTTAASFDPEVIVPGFIYSLTFAADSYAEFCLAADSSAYLCRNLFKRIEVALFEL